MLPVDAQFKLLQKVLRLRYGDRVAVAYRQRETIADEGLRRDAYPLPALAVNGKVILRGRLDLQAIVAHLAELGIQVL
ncbi:MAG: hypothetical protein AB1441_01900 [Bacillota bacterium]